MSFLMITFIFFGQKATYIKYSTYIRIKFEYLYNLTLKTNLRKV